MWGAITADRSRLAVGIPTIYRVAAAFLPIQILPFGGLLPIRLWGSLIFICGLPNLYGRGALRDCHEGAQVYPRINFRRHLAWQERPPWRSVCY